jgi:protein gp37
MGATKIEWTKWTWNPVIGCTPVSPGCENCFARRMAGRLKRMGVPQYQQDSSHVRCLPDRLTEPFKWRRPCHVFVCSMGDLFHDQVSDQFIDAVFSTMAACPEHTFQLLTKRPKRIANHGMHRAFGWPPNVWAGVTVENADYLNRIDALSQCGAPVKFVSFEPLLGDIRDRPTHERRVYPYWADRVDMVDWVIVGGETGPGARPMHPAWARAIRDHCVETRKPFFFKQHSTKSRRNRLLDGRLWEQRP